MILKVFKIFAQIYRFFERFPVSGHVPSSFPRRGAFALLSTMVLGQISRTPWCSPWRRALTSAVGSTMVGGEVPKDAPVMSHGGAVDDRDGIRDIAYKNTEI